MIFSHTGWFVVILFIWGIGSFFTIKGWYTIFWSGIHPAYLYSHSSRTFFGFSRPNSPCFVSTPYAIQCGWLVGLVLTGGQQCHCQCGYYNILSFHTRNCTFVAKMQCFLLKQIMVDPHPWGRMSLPVVHFLLVIHILVMSILFCFTFLYALAVGIDKHSLVVLLGM